MIPQPLLPGQHILSGSFHEPFPLNMWPHDGMEKMVTAVYSKGNFSEDAEARCRKSEENENYYQQRIDYKNCCFNSRRKCYNLRQRRWLVLRAENFRDMCINQNRKQPDYTYKAVAYMPTISDGILWKLKNTINIADLNKVRASCRTGRPLMLWKIYTREY